MLRFVACSKHSRHFGVGCADVAVLFPDTLDMPPLAFVASPSQPGCSAAAAVLSTNTIMSSKVASGKRINVSTAIGLLCSCLVDSKFGESPGWQCDSTFCPPIAHPALEKPCPVGVDFLLACLQASCLGIRRGSICPVQHLPPSTNVQLAAEWSQRVPSLMQRPSFSHCSNGSTPELNLLAWLGYCSHAQLHLLGVATQSGPMCVQGASCSPVRGGSEHPQGLTHLNCAYLSPAGATAQRVATGGGQPSPTYEFEVSLPHCESFAALKLQHGVKRAYI
jgi:hypothetical protein